MGQGSTDTSNSKCIKQCFILFDFKSLPLWPLCPGAAAFKPDCCHGTVLVLRAHASHCDWELSATSQLTNFPHEGLSCRSLDLGQKSSEADQVLCKIRWCYFFTSTFLPEFFLHRFLPLTYLENDKIISNHEPTKGSDSFLNSLCSAPPAISVGEEES